MHTSERVTAHELLGRGIEARDFVLADPSGEPLSAAMLTLADPQRRARVGALGPAAAMPCVWDRGADALLALYESLIR